MTLNKQTSLLASGNRKPFPCDSTHERKKCTVPVRFDKCTSVEQAASVVKNGEDGYFDTASVKVSKVGGVQVVMFDALTKRV